MEAVPLEDSTLSIYFEDVAPIVAFGSDIKINVALRSVSYPGGVETLGVIRNVSIIDASTGLTLLLEDMNIVGSASATDYKFELEALLAISAERARVSLCKLQMLTEILRRKPLQ